MRESGNRSRRRMALVFLLAAVLVSSGIAITPAHAGTGLRAQMAPLINDDRTDKDRTALVLDLELSRYARRHSQDMANAGELFHTNDLAAKLKGKNWSIGGENVGVAPSLAALEDMFMASTPHRRNILNRQFDHFAVGVVESDGNFWVTVIFYG
ncbi:MAG TPA: CAP domain-containing protein [Actinomycetota bacterium]|nr:CAP domain-containing protein [Actinomycetota bacterium]